MQKAVLFIAVLMAAVSFGASETTNKDLSLSEGVGEGEQRAEVPATKSPIEASNSTPSASNETVSGELEGAVRPPSGSGFWGDIDLRPSWTTKAGSFDTENTVEFGYKFNADRLLAYTQYWNTNLYSPNNPNYLPIYRSNNLVAQDGFLRYKMKNLWVSDDKTWSFTWEPRLYLPTDPNLRGNGLIAATRQYLILAKKLSDQATLSFVELPIYWGFAQPGGDFVGIRMANPVIEFREYVILDYSLFNGFVDLSLNILINHQRTRDYLPGALFNNRWWHMVWTWPEIDFSVAPHATLGLSYYSMDLIQPDFSGLDLKNGLEQGTVQVVMRASL